MKHVSVLIKPASSLCNIRCKYCFYANVSSLREVRSYGRMSDDIMKKMIANIYLDLEDGDELTIAFQGGEPTLAGLKYYRRFVSLIQQQGKKVIVHYAIQTNGIMINTRWCEFFKENNFLVGLSIDGSPTYHDQNRVDVRHQGTFQRVLQAKRLFDKYQVDYNVLCVLTNPLAQEATTVFEFVKEENIRYIQFIPCLDDLDTIVPSDYGLTSKSFATFYHQLLNLWLKELTMGNYISIKLFDDIVNLLVRQQQTACGMLGNCRVQYVIEADGSVYPCDFYVLDEYRMGYIQEETLRELFNKPMVNTFLCSRGKLPQKCTGCPFANICKGGCKRMKDAVYVDEAQDYCGYQELLVEFIPRISQILESIGKIRL